MSPRPGQKSRSSGCFLIAFFSVFAGIALLMLYAFITGEKKSGLKEWGVVFIPLIFSVVGVGGLIIGIRQFFGVSRRSKPASNSLSTASAQSVVKGYALPSLEPLQMQSNGYKRLNPESSQRAQFWLLTIVAIFWNGIIWLFFYAKNGSKDEAPTWFLLIFAAVGLFLIYQAIKSLIRMIMVGQAHIDIDVEPASPGQVITLMLSQPGSFAIDGLVIDLVCKESATYRVGTDTRTKTEIVREVPVCNLTGLKSRNDKVLANQVVKIPEDAMPAFIAPNNEVNWMVRLKLILPGRPDVDQLYPVRVISKECAATGGGVHG